MLKQFTKKDKRTLLEKEIDSVIQKMNKFDPSSEEYSKMAENLERLYRAKSNDKTSKVSRDMIWQVGGSLLGIGLILGFEKANIVTSKAIGFVLRGRV